MPEVYVFLREKEKPPKLRARSESSSMRREADAVDFDGALGLAYETWTDISTK